MPRPPLTTRQTEFLRYIEARRLAAVSPTVDEIRRHFGVASTNGVHDVLDALRRKGYIRWTPGQSRTMVVLDDRGEMVPAPLPPPPRPVSTAPVVRVEPVRRCPLCARSHFLPREAHVEFCPGRAA